MRKIHKITFILLILIFLNEFTVFATENNMIEYHQLTQEEIGSDISIPNRDGGWNVYGEIYTFEDLYSVMEDLSAEYKNLLEDYNALKNQNDELAQEIRELKDSDEYIKDSSENKDYSYVIIILVGIVIIFIYKIYKK